MEADDVWQELYKACLLETDDEKLHKRLRAAKAAIDVQLHELQSDHHGGTPDERQAISDALAVLNVLRREREARSHDTIRATAGDGTKMLDEEWTKTLADGRRVKFTNQELPDEVAFITAQIAGNKVVYSIILAKAKSPLTREEVESHFEDELSKK